jgi:hypothetical protein
MRFVSGGESRERPAYAGEAGFGEASTELREVGASKESGDDHLRP